ncbi:MAG: phenylacetate--CoA ligase family protein [Candidatus Atribacteria bacterium]|nr:phenylacetate--CoA ligase family protein [Candidatus Atribacteria bacterium]
MNKFFVKNFLFPIHEFLLGRKTLALLKTIDNSQWLSSENLEIYQYNKLKTLLKYAYENVHYYRDSFCKIGLIPEDIKSVKDLKNLPFITKNLIKRNLEKFKSASLRKKLFRMNTGGSTGEPLIFFVDKDRICHDRAAHLRARRWWNIDIGDKEIVFWGSPVELNTQDRLKTFRDLFLNTKLLSAFKMGERQMFEYAKMIEKYKPKHIFGYPSSIYLFSRFLRKNGIKINQNMVRTIFVTGEVLYPYQKVTIEQTFGCPVANGYGGRDGGFIAHECPQHRLHVSEDIIVEIINEKGEPASCGEKGEIVITHLNWFGMPFIRYKMGDIASRSDEMCPCGRVLPILTNIQGRSADFILTPEGNILHALSVIYPIRDIEGIQQFKIIQKTLNSLIVNIVKSEDYNCKSENKLNQYFEQLLGKDVTVEIDYVDNIAEEKSGKFRHVVSHVKPEVLN